MRAFLALLLTLLALQPLATALDGGSRPSRGKMPDTPADVPDYSGAGVILAPLPSGAPHVVVPMLHSSPKLSDFLPNKPTAPVVRRMLRIPHFIQRYPDVWNEDIGAE